MRRIAHRVVVAPPAALLPSLRPHRFTRIRSPGFATRCSSRRGADLRRPRFKASPIKRQSPKAVSTEGGTYQRACFQSASKRAAMQCIREFVRAAERPSLLCGPAECGCSFLLPRLLPLFPPWRRLVAGAAGCRRFDAQRPTVDTLLPLWSALVRLFMVRMMMRAWGLLHIASRQMPLGRTQQRVHALATTMSEPALVAAHSARLPRVGKSLLLLVDDDRRCRLLPSSPAAVVSRARAGATSGRMGKSPWGCRLRSNVIR